MMMDLRGPAGEGKRKNEEKGKNKVKILIFIIAIIATILAILFFAVYINIWGEKLTTTTITITQQQITTTTTTIATTATTTTTTFEIIKITTTITTLITTTSVATPTTTAPTTTIDLTAIELKNIAEKYPLVKDILAQEPDIEPRIKKLSKVMIKDFKSSGKVPEDVSDEEIYFVDYIKTNGQGVSLMIDLENKKILKTSVIVRVE